MGISYSPHYGTTPKTFLAATTPVFYSEMPTVNLIIHVLGFKSGRVPKYIAYAFKTLNAETSIEITLTLNNFIGTHSESGTRKKIKVLLNPFSGKRRSLVIYETIVFPIMKLACIDINMEVSNYAGHILEIVKNMDLTGLYGIVTVSGDGLMHEVISSLLTRHDWETARKIPIGMVAAGTSIPYHFLTFITYQELDVDSQRVSIVFIQSVLHLLF